MPPSITTTASNPTVRRIPATFRALRHRNYLYWFIGQGISLIGSWMQTMAQQVLVYRLTGSATSLGIVNFVALIPLIPLSLWGGSIIDRFSKRTIILITQIIMMAQAFILAVLTWSGTVQPWHIYLLSFILGAVNAVDMPARQAFTVDMIEGKEDLTNAIGLNSAMFNGARALGPALAGIVVAVTGEGNAFFWNGLTFVAVIISLLLMKNLPQSSQQKSRTGMISHTAEGLQFIFHNRTILILMTLIAVSAFLSMPYSTLMPVFAEQVLKDSAQPVVTFFCNGNNPIIHCQAPEALPLGMLLTMVGFGAVVGALFVASLPDSTRRGKWLTLGNIAFPLGLLGLALSKSFPFSMGIVFFIGISFVLQNALVNTMLQLACPDDKRGRVMSVYTLTFQAMMRLGGLQAGVFADRIGAQLCVGIGAGISLIYGLYIAIKHPEIRHL